MNYAQYMSETHKKQRHGRTYIILTVQYNTEMR